MHEIESVTKFNTAIAKGKVLVDFWAPWCTPCKVLTPVLEEVATANKAVSFVKINADTEYGQVIASQYGLGSLPTMMLFQNGVKTGSLVGNTTKAKIQEFISK